MHQTLEELQINFQQIEKMHADKLTQGNITVDPWLQPKSDDGRIGLSLIFPVGTQMMNYSSLCANYIPFKNSLYLYPQEDLHITLFDIFPAVLGFQISNEKLHQYCELLRALFKTIPAFQIDLNGILFTDSAGFIKGFDDLKLHHIRTRIRERLTAVKLPYQERYQSKIAHITFCRFKNKLTRAKELQQINQKLRQQPLSTLQIKEVSLVIHDCYNLSSKTKIIDSIPLSG